MNDFEQFFNGVKDQIVIVPGNEPEPCATCAGMHEVRNADGDLVPCPDCAEGRAIIQRQTTRMVAAAGVPDAYLNIRLADFEALGKQRKQGKMLAIAAANFVADFGPGAASRLSDLYEACGVVYPHANDPLRCHLLFWGGVGVGKTALMAAVANELALTGAPVLFVRARQLIDNVQAAYKSAETREAALRRFQEAKVLMIDEVSAELASADDKRDILEEVLRYRMPREALTMLTTNSTPAEFRAAWGERTAEAVEEGAHMIPMGGANLRDKFQIGAEDAF